MLLHCRASWARTAGTCASSLIALRLSLSRSGWWCEWETEPCLVTSLLPACSSRWLTTLLHRQQWISRLESTVGWGGSTRRSDLSTPDDDRWDGIGSKGKAYQGCWTPNIAEREREQSGILWCKRDQQMKLPQTRAVIKFRWISREV